MKYYKIIIDSEIIGVCTSNDYFCFQPKHQMLIRTIEDKVEYIECNNKLYHAGWMRPITNELYYYTPAVILEIEEQEYNILAPISEPIPIVEEEEDIPEEPVIEPVDVVGEITIDYVRTAKLNEMSNACRAAITSGIDLQLRGETHHFSLSTQDQLNLMTLSVMAQTSDEIPYHADGEEVIFYTADEINQIVAAANAHKIYHTTYYNALKSYINALDTIEEISAITYGTEIPEEYKSEVLKALE